ncbi:MAG: class I SAM-dependent methyltransferase [Bacteroidota bacterium]|nr:class I SAM-dependent methyltransferase [Bacteroidota bacterium]
MRQHRRVARLRFSMTALKEIVHTRLPKFYNVAKSAFYGFHDVFGGKAQHEIVFNKIYRTNAWGDPESVSGAGSNTVNTEVVRRELPALVRELNAQSMLDIPCGDFFWMKDVALPVERYIGADIVEELLQRNVRRFGDSLRTFLLLDVLKEELPRADVILCRDLLPHFSFRQIAIALEHIKRSCSRYLLTTTYVARAANTDIQVGVFRPLNLQAEPFNFPAPLKVINEHCVYGDGMYFDKSLALWRMDDIPSQSTFV